MCVYIINCLFKSVHFMQFCTFTHLSDFLEMQNVFLQRVSDDDLFGEMNIYRLKTTFIALQLNRVMNKLLSCY